MKRVNYTLEKTAQGWVFKSESGEVTSEFKSTESGIAILAELLKSKMITHISAKALLEKITDQETLPVLEDENKNDLGQVLKSISIAEWVRNLQTRLKWAILFNNVEAPTFVMCECGMHGRIKIDNDNSTGDILSKSSGKDFIGQLIDKKMIDDAGAKKVFLEISDSILPEFEEKEDEESLSDGFPFSGIMVVSMKAGPAN